MNMNVDFFRAIEEFVGRWIIRILGFLLFVILFVSAMIDDLFKWIGGMI